MPEKSLGVYPISIDAKHFRELSEDRETKEFIEKYKLKIKYRHSGLSRIIDISNIKIQNSIENAKTTPLGELTKEGQTLLVARGGMGGRGNWQFRSSSNTTPLESEPGTAGEVKNLFLECTFV
jgi:GTPase involved in cell partitioning and DNA repair